MRLYQAYRGPPFNDYIYTTSFSEANKTAGYTYDGITGRVLLTPAQGSRPLYRLYNPVRQAHFYTTYEKGRKDAIAQGSTKVGTVGYVYQTSADKLHCPCAEVHPLYRLVKKDSPTRYFYTMDEAEVERAVNERWYKYEEIVACMYPF